MLDFQKVKLKVSLLSFDSAQDEYLFFFSCYVLENSVVTVSFLP